MSPTPGGNSRRRAALAADGVLPWDGRQELGRAALARRFRYVHDTSGAKVRLGAAWFVMLCAACWAAAEWREARLAALLLAAPLSGMAVVAALQSATAWRRAGRRASREVSAAAAAAVGLGAVVSSQVVGAAVLIGAVASLIGAAASVVEARRCGGQVARRPRHLAPEVGEQAAATIRCWLFVGLAAAAPVLALRVEPAQAIVAVVLAAAYDAGDFLVGSAASNVVEGPLAGMIGALVVTFAIAVVEPPGLVGGQAWVFGLLAIVTCPLGPLLASAVLPRASSFAPALRRLDSLLVVGPLWLAAWH